MSQSQILEIKKGQTDLKETTANLLPCRVYHTGSVDPAAAYWDPSISEDETRTAYFRGRKLQGKTTKLPDKYRGVILKREAESQGALNRGEEHGEAGDEVAPKIGTMQVMAEFDKLVVWSHEDIANATSDPYLRSVEEWLQAAEQIHSHENLHVQDGK